MKVFLTINFLFLFPLILFGQVKSFDCQQIKTGTFYFYPHKSKHQYIIIRESLLQKEINLNTNDTSLWKVNWQNDCIFDLKFISITRILSEFEKSFFNSHFSVIEIIDVKQDYYIFQQGLDSLNSINPVFDTLWFKTKEYPESNLNLQ